MTTKQTQINTFMAPILKDGQTLEELRPNDRALYFIVKSLKIYNEAEAQAVAESYDNQIDIDEEPHQPTEALLQALETAVFGRVMEVTGLDPLGLSDNLQQKMYHALTDDIYYYLVAETLNKLTYGFIRIDEGLAILSNLDRVNVKKAREAVAEAEHYFEGGHES